MDALPRVSADNELLDVLAAYDDTHPKLDRLEADIRALRDRLRVEFTESGEASESRDDP